MKIFVTSDEHFGHKNIIKYCSRPFSDVEEMDSVLISNFNKVVGIDDLTYHLGDFTFNNFKKYSEQLNGENVFLVGNHDRWAKKEVNLKDYLEIYHNGCLFVMCHYPIFEWKKKHYGAIHLHGHTHGNKKDGNNFFDVGVDANGFFPVLLDDLLKRHKI